MYHVAEGAIDWLYTIGFEHSFDQPEVVISGFALDGMATMIADVADFFARGGEFAEARILEQPDDAALMFRSVHPELARLGALPRRGLVQPQPDARRAGRRGRRPTTRRCRCSRASGCPAAEQSISWRSFLSLDAGDWRHPVPWDTRVLVNKSITAGREWAYVVIHDEAGEWQCMDGHEFTPDDFELVPLFAILEVDPSVAEVLELAPGSAPGATARTCPGSASATGSRAQQLKLSSRRGARPLRRRSRTSASRAAPRDSDPRRPGRRSTP